MVVIAISSLMIILAGISKAIMDKIQFHFDKSIFSDDKRFKELFWNPKISWRNKWSFNAQEHKLEERFLGSSTVFVWTTDAWHCFQFILYNLVFGVIGLRPEFTNNIVLNLLVSLIVFKSLFTATFELFFRYIFEKK